MVKFSLYLLPDDGIFPNSILPLLVYFDALREGSDAEAVQRHFATHQWKNSWINGVYSYHHYHSITHEVMGIVKGSSEILFGGEGGVCITLGERDVVIIPAGVAHKCLEAGEDFSCVGAYPDGHDFDIKFGHKEERPETDQNINRVPLPDLDPIFGVDGKIHKYWK